MKLQLPPPNNFSTANSRSAYSAAPQRQGLTFAPCARRLIADIYQQSAPARGASPDSPVVVNYFPEIIRQIQEHKDGLTAFADFMSSTLVVNIPTTSGYQVRKVSLGPNNLQQALEALMGQLPEMRSLKDENLSNLPDRTADLEDYLFGSA
jgi:hypothetical protein